MCKAVRHVSPTEAQKANIGGVHGRRGLRELSPHRQHVPEIEQGLSASPAATGRRLGSNISELIPR
eukprot:2162253-Alexandrium_andersonii.AAC.1